jgi:hypothetical protein
LLLRTPTNHATPEETNAAILSTWASCCGSVRYGGQDHEVLIRLAEIGSAECCDNRLDNEPKRVNRNHVSFEFVGLEAPETGSVAAEKIKEHFAAFLRKTGRILDFRCSSMASSFRFEWGRGSDIYNATFMLEPRKESGWLLQILRDDHHSSTAFAIGIYKALEHDPRFRLVNWFAEDEWQEGATAGRPRPY